MTDWIFATYRGSEAEAMTLQALGTLYTSNDAWARRVIHQVRGYVSDPASMRALGFCVGVSHAEFMARHFNLAGIRATAVSGNTPREDRRAALADLRDGKIQVVFSVDIFNEGVDVPVVDTIIMLRPTDSATVFLQQLGRGLRKSHEGGKSACTVLDLIGHQHDDFRFDRKLRALVGGTRKHIKDGVDQNFPYLPAGCHLELDRVAKRIVLENIERSVPSSFSRQQSELRAMLAEGLAPTLAGFLEHTGLELEDIRTQNRGWSDLLESVGVEVAEPGPEEKTLRRAIGRMLHIDDRNGDLRRDPRQTDHFSPITRYRDYAISRDLFHWESQSTTSAQSPTGVRYCQQANGDSSVFLFARESRDERAFWFLGPATYVSQEGERPMAITWRLDHPIPGDLYAELVVAAVA